jgi:uncharacterized membrane protein YhhN
MEFRSTAGRIALAGAVAGSLGYMAAKLLPIGPAPLIAWKGSGVGLLALYAALRARTADGWLIAAVMALGALGDVLLDALGMTQGALAFLAGHVTAVVLYLRSVRPGLALGEKLFAALLAPGVAAVAFLLPSDRATAPGVALYALGLGAMAATAWLSRFPRSLTGLGALLFVASDLLIFARGGPLAGLAWAGFAIWPLYFAGQAMICLGVVGTLARAPGGGPGTAAAEGLAAT